MSSSLYTNAMLWHKKHEPIPFKEMTIVKCTLYTNVNFFILKFVWNLWSFLWGSPFRVKVHGSATKSGRLSNDHNGSNECRSTTSLSVCRAFFANSAFRLLSLSKIGFYEALRLDACQRHLICIFMANRTLKKRNNLDAFLPPALQRSFSKKKKTQYNVEFRDEFYLWRWI